MKIMVRKSSMIGALLPLLFLVSYALIRGNTNSNIPIEAGHVEDEYLLTFTESSNQFDTNDTSIEVLGLATTDLGNSVEFNYAQYTASIESWTLLSQNGYFYNKTPISGMKSLQLSLDTGSSVLLSYGWIDRVTQTINYRDVDILLDEVTPSTTFNNERPDCFKLLNATTDTITIISMQITYTCSASTDPYLDTAASWTDLSFTYIEETNSYEVSGYVTTPLQSTAITPVYDDGVHGLHHVTHIGNSAFENCETLQSIGLPNTITTIGQYAFYGCTTLVELGIPETVTTINEGAFSSCGALEIVVIPYGVTTLAKSLLSDCTSLTSLTLPSSLTIIEQEALLSCSSLASIVIPNSVLTIEDGAFNFCLALTSITLYSGLTTIGNYAFLGCSALTSITIPNSVTSLGDYAFYQCTKLAMVTLSNNLTSLGDYTFYECTSLMSLTIQAGVTSIGMATFTFCSTLSSIDIPASVTSIGMIAFRSCGVLSAIYIPATVTSIEANAFLYCYSLTIYCEALSKPAGWNSAWNPSNCPVEWGYDW